MTTIEPRTRTAAEVADHASDVADDIELLYGSRHARSFPGILERLAAQVEDLAAVVDNYQALASSPEPGPTAERLPLTLACELDPEDDTLSIVDYGAGSVGIQARRRSSASSVITVVLPPAQARRLARAILAYVGA